MAKLYFYYSAMNAGKSTILLQSDYNYNERGMTTLRFTPKLDDRYGAGNITSRIGLQNDAELFEKNTDLFTNVKKKTQDQTVDCILIDEAQFLTKAQVKQLTQICDCLSIPVLTYGLRSDFMAEPFEGSQYLLALADNLIEIKTICHCGRKAIMNARIDENGKQVTKGAQVHIGHGYISTCRRHFNEGKMTATKKEKAPVAEPIT
jgi:thymidine kinase